MKVALDIGNHRIGAPCPFSAGSKLIIDGDEGVIKLEAEGLLSGFFNAMPPSKVILNDEEVALEGVPFVGNTGKNWEEFAKGDKGEYPTFDDAVDLHKLIDAIWRSSQEGKRIDL